MNYNNRLFVSYTHDHQANVQDLITELRSSGISAWWDKDIKLGDRWRERLHENIGKSRHFLLYCTAQTKGSEMVTDEVRTFMESAKDDPTRKLFVLRSPDCQDKHIPVELGEVQHPRTLHDVIIDVLKETSEELTGRLLELQEEHKREREDLEKQLIREQERVQIARRYYRHQRFWGPFAEHDKVHIFTCGRDIPPDPTRPRGTSGYRTAIDKWDYRAVLGIAHFFASNYPAIRLTIEDPESKLQQEDINRTQVLANRIAQVGELLRDKNCIIIGSPDVNDFAEIALSRIHQIDPYDDDRKKSRGFVLIRDQKNTASAFYWKTSDQEREGIAKLESLQPVIHEFRPPPTQSKSRETGTMNGILTVADNPFCVQSGQRKIMILSGFSGVATHAIAKLLTEDNYLKSFYAFDEAQAQEKGDIEALIEVKYFVRAGHENRDARQIDESPTSIRFVELVAL